MSPPTFVDTASPSRARQWSARGAVVLGVCGLVGVLLGNAPLDEPPLHTPQAAPGAVSVVTHGVGQHAPVAPSAPDLHLGPASIDSIRLHLEAGDTVRALHAAEAMVEVANWGRERDAALMVVGLLRREKGDHNLASEAFTSVRSSKGSLAPIAAYFEAEQDLARGREWVAIQECEAYKKAWPKGDHAGGCSRIIAIAYARLGKRGSARAAALEYDREHENGTIAEQIDLRLARSLVVSDPEAAVPALQQLAVSHASPLTGRVAEELLASLNAELPDDIESRKTRALSMRDAKRKDAAWEAFEALAAESADDPNLQRWVEGGAERFGWRTHRWDYLADYYAAAYADDADAKHLWSQYKVLGRGGRHADAAVLAVEGQKKHGASPHWRRKEEHVGQTMLLAGRYPDAVIQFDAVASRGGWTGRRAAFFSAFATLMAGEANESVARFSKIIDADKSHDDAARYWRSKSYDLLEQTDSAEADRAWIRENEPSSWYAVLIAQSEPETPQIKPFVRAGNWAGPPPAIMAPPSIAPLPTVAATEPSLARPVVPGPATAQVATPSSFGSLGWSPGAAAPAPPSRTVIEQLTEVSPPPSYRASNIYSRDDASAEMSAFVAEHAKTWPELGAIRDLASVGLYDLSGPMLSRWFEEWKTNYRHGQTQARRVKGMDTGDWRRLFLFSRDHHHSARFTYEWWDSLTEPADIEASWRLAHPLAHAHTVWTHSRTHNIDPYMVLGLMRQESTYNAVAVSRVGASGAMQIMPSTGHLLADLAHDVDFTAGDLEDPELSISYGITYLGLLMERFDGVYPLAVASYNGGPHNVSAWLKGTGSDMPIDAFVEHIPYRETRDYVKKVSSGYHAYVQLYGPDGAAIVMPETPHGDHPEVVDF